MEAEGVTCIPIEDVRIMLIEHYNFMHRLFYEDRNGPRFLDSCLSVICPHMQRPDYAATGHITFPSYT